MSGQIREESFGWSYEILGLTNIRMPSDIAWPTDEMLRTDREKGEWGFLDTSHPDYPAYEDALLAYVSNAVADQTFIVLPEFSMCKQLEDKIRRLLEDKAASMKCVVIGGSYYRQREDDSIESVCPIITPLHEKPFYQEKLLPSPRERDRGCSAAEGGTLSIFSNTGFGDFAVLVCSDALKELERNSQVDRLRDEIDILVVIARNRSQALPNHVRDLARIYRWVTVYCTSIPDEHASEVSLPYRDEQPVPASSTGYERLDLRQLSGAMSQYLLGNIQASRLSEVADAAGFKATPRHWPSSRLNSIGFRRHLKVLAIGSHFDDLWLGCSGTLMLLRELYHAQVVWTHLCDQYPHPYFGYVKIDSTRLNDVIDRNAKRLGFQWLPPTNRGISDRNFRGSSAALTKAFEALKEEYFNPDLILVPRRDDAHEDHVLTTREALITFRQVNILEYEVKDFRQAPFKPNFFVDLSYTSNWDFTLRDGTTLFKAGAGTFAEKKARILAKGFEEIVTAYTPHSFQQEKVLGRMAFRAEGGRIGNYAEAFVADVVA
jgi:LmbE family N-acetylglucosaminyl deacetylase